MYLDRATSILNGSSSRYNVGYEYGKKITLLPFSVQNKHLVKFIPFEDVDNT
jgi:hypothetical protein